MHQRKTYLACQRLARHALAQRAEPQRLHQHQQLLLLKHARVQLR